MTGFEPSPILNFKSVAQHPTTTPAIAAAGPLQNFAVYMRNILTDTVPNHDPDPKPAWRGDQLPYSNKCNSMLTSGTRGETLSPNECHSTPPSVIRGIYPHPYKYVYAHIPSESSMIFRQHCPGVQNKRQGEEVRQVVFLERSRKNTFCPKNALILLIIYCLKRLASWMIFSVLRQNTR